MTIIPLIHAGAGFSGLEITTLISSIQIVHYSRFLGQASAGFAGRTAGYPRSGADRRLVGSGVLVLVMNGLALP
ncbi:MAG TPA: hypothetical protein VGR16_01390 [Thermomicrobiales bacterium]|nr:hypothetical protein [Thermomicrobiales bacterium]